MPYKISGTMDNSTRVIILKESDWSIESNTTETGTYEITTTSGLKTVIGRRVSDGESAGYGKVSPLYTAPTVDPNTGIIWTTRTPPSQPHWRGVVWSPELDIFVATSYYNSNSYQYERVMTSPDGITWTGYPNADDNMDSWFSICWSPALSLFVAVSHLGRSSSPYGQNSNKKIMTSPDGTNWTIRSATNTGLSLYDVVWSPELAIFVIVGRPYINNDQIMTSTDGINWTERDYISVSDGWRSVCWSPELTLFVAVGGDNNRVMTSPDGINWTARTAGAGDSSEWHGVCWSPELTLFVAVANSGSSRIITSPDGTNWSTRSAPATKAWTGITWSAHQTLFVAVAQSGTSTDIMTSPDGIDWESRTSTDSPGLFGICWSLDLKMFVAVGASSPTAILTSG